MTVIRNMLEKTSFFEKLLGMSRYEGIWSSFVINQTGLNWLRTQLIWKFYGDCDETLIFINILEHWNELTWYVPERGGSYQLYPGHVLFPPYIFLVLRTHRCHHVVEIHDYMHHRVEESDDHSLFTCKHRRVLHYKIFYFVDHATSNDSW